MANPHMFVNDFTHSRQERTIMQWGVRSWGGGQLWSVLEGCVTNELMGKCKLNEWITIFPSEIGVM